MMNSKKHNQLLFDEGNMHEGILCKLMNKKTDCQKIYRLFEKTSSSEYGLTQEKTGYCWLISALNCVIKETQKKYSSKDICFSKNYLIYYDKLEKANWFLEKMIETAALPLESKEVRYLLGHAMTDEGQWAMAENLIKKYGLVPYEIMQESIHTHCTGEINACLSMMLRCYAVRLREAATEGRPEETIAGLKNRAMNQVEKVLTACFGRPPKEIELPGWLGIMRNRDEKGCIRLAAPRDFYEHFICFPFDQYVSVASVGQRRELNHTIAEVLLDGNVEGGKKNSFLYVSEKEFLHVLSRQIAEQTPCWIACDAGKFYFRESGLFDDSIIDLKSFFGEEPEELLDRKHLYPYKMAGITHAMVLAEKAVDEQNIVWWKAQNSQSNILTGKTECFLSDNWVKKYVALAAVKKEYLLSDLVKQIREMQPWDFFHLT